MHIGFSKIVRKMHNFSHTAIYFWYFANGTLYHLVKQAPQRDLKLTSQMRSFFFPLFLPKYSSETKNAENVNLLLLGRKIHSTSKYTSNVIEACMYFTPQKNPQI